MKKSDREKVLNKYGCKCAYCGKDIDLKTMQVDHIKPQRLNGHNDFDNLNPACKSCNHYKRALDLEGFRQYIKTLHERIEKQYITRVGIDFGVVTITPFSGLFYFETLDK